MAKVIAFSNQKGGVGKTTSTLNIGAYLSKIGKNILFIDLDPQCNLSSAWGMIDNDENVYSTLLGEKSVFESIFEITDKMKCLPKGRLAIIPGSSNLSRYEKMRSGELNSQMDLKEQLNKIQEKFDYILLDCPPAVGLITINAYCSSDFVFIPMEAQLFAMEGLRQVNDTIMKTKEFFNPKIEIGGIFFNRYDKRKIINKEIEEVLIKKYGKKVLKNFIRENVSLKEAPHKQEDIFSYEKSSNGATDFKNLTNEILTIIN